MPPLAHLLENEDGTGGNAALALIAIAAMVIPIVGLGFLGRYFLRAGREDATDAPVRRSPDPSG